MKLSDRYSITSLETGSTDQLGRLFFNDTGITDLSNVTVVGASVDTIRQLYYGVPSQIHIDSFNEKLDRKTDFCYLCQPADENGVIGERYYQFHLSRMGKTARYRFKLQNNDLGIVVLFGSYFTKLDDPGQHLKIELSPKFICGKTATHIQEYLNHLASRLLQTYEPRGCSVHLACDYQGYSLPSDFLSAFTTYSRTIRTYDGLSSIDLSDISEAVATYGGAKQERNYLIGKASAMQMALYDKSHEIIKSDKVDYFHTEWQAYSLGQFNPTKPVRRIEARLHHHIIREIGLGMNETFESFLDISEYLTDLWRYALTRNRLNVAGSRELIHPFWQLLMQDVYFSTPAKNIDIVRKKKQAVDPVAHNFSAVIGNIISIMARQGANAKQVLAQLKFLSFYNQIIRYYNSRGLNESDLFQHIEKGLALRGFLGKAA